MPGQLGNVKNTIQNLIIVKIIEEDNVILVKGSIPGHDGSKVLIKHTQKKYTLRKVLSEDLQAGDELQTKENNSDQSQDSKPTSSEKETSKEEPKKASTNEDNKS